jgi:hypothetical protein
MGRSAPRRVVLDAGALIAFERGDARIRAVIQRARDRGADIVIPAGALAQVWRDSARQSRLAALVGARGVRILPLTERVAKAAGQLCVIRGTSNVIDASVILAAREVSSVVLTSDINDLRLLDPTLALVPV